MTKEIVPPSLLLSSFELETNNRVELLLFRVDFEFFIFHFREYFIANPRILLLLFLHFLLLLRADW